MAVSQTLSRGLDALAFICAATPPTIDDVADHLGTHRSVAYRIIRTLEDHRLIARDSDGRCRPAVGLAALAHGMVDPVRLACAPELVTLATDLGLTAFLTVSEGDDAVTVDSVEPPDTLVGVTYRPGLRHPLTSGAPGLAISASRPHRTGERPEVDEARHRGWAESTGEVIPGMAAVAAPLDGHDAAICVVHLAGDDSQDHRELGPVLAAAAQRATDRLRSDHDTSSNASRRTP